MLIKNGLVYRDNNFSLANVRIEDGIITEICDYETDALAGEEEYDATGLYIIPGLIDIHLHGCVGYDFCDANIDAYNAMAIYQYRHGITTICPASMSYSEEELGKIFAEFALWKLNSDFTGKASFAGINMEGPFISSEKKGAQNPDNICNPDIEVFRHLQEISGNMIKLVDMAPEIPGGLEFIEELSKEVKISLSHSNADYNIASESFIKGASHVTHLYNGMNQFTSREPGIVGAAADREDVTVELICDGIHIHPSVVRQTFKMFGKNRIVLVSDSMRACGLMDGRYMLGGQECTVKGNLATVTGTDTIAGSVTNLYDCMKIAVNTMDIPLETVVQCVTENPACVLGIFDRIGSIDKGKEAKLLAIDKNLNLVKVFA